MLGYTQEDVLRMLAGIRLAHSYLPLNSSNDEIRKELNNAYDFLDGLLMEGHVK